MKVMVAVVRVVGVLVRPMTQQEVSGEEEEERMSVCFGAG